MSKDSFRRCVTGLSMALIACVALALATGCSGRRSQQQTEIGNTFLGIGKISDAREAFEKALDLNPENIEAEIGLARCLAAQDNLDEALAHYRNVIERDASNETAYVEAVRILLRRERTEEANELASAYEKIDPEKGGILHAFVLRTSGKVEEAIALLEGMVETHPNSAEVRINLATAQMTAGQDEAAVATLEQILDKLDPDSLSARMKLVEVYQKQGKIDEIVTQFREMAKQKPDDLGIRLALARSLVDKQEYPEAEDIARAILQDMPESGWANYVVGACLLAREQYKEAVPYLQTATQALPEFDVVRERLALARRGGAPETIPAQTETAGPGAVPSPLKPAPDSQSWQALWQQARLDLLLEKADALLANEVPNMRETLSLAALFAKDRARAQQLAEGLPNDSPVPRLLASLADRDPNAALAVFDTWTETGPERTILRDNAFGFALVLVGARAKALEVLSARYAENPENAVALYNLATMYHAAGLPDYAVQVLQKLLAQYPENLGVRHELLRLLIQADKIDRARSVAELSYQLNPGDPESVVDLARVYRSTGDLDLAENVLRSALESAPESGPVRIAAARVQLIKGLPDEALLLLEGHEFTGDASPAAQALRAFALAETGDWPAVAAACESVPADKRSLGLHLLFAAARLQEGNAEAAAAALAQAGDIPWRRVNGVGVLAAVLGMGDAPPGSENLASRLKEQPGDFATYAYGVACLAESFNDRALAVFDQLKETVPDSPAITNLMLDALAGAVRVPEPLQKAESIAQQAPEAAATWLAVAEFYLSRDESERTGAAIQKAIELDGDNAGAWLLQARLLEKEGDKNGAAAAYERVLTLRPDDPVVSNNLAYLLLETDGDAERARQLADSALAKVQGNPIVQPHVLHTLGLAELRTGKLEDAEKHLGLALQMRPGDPTLLLDFGTMLIEKGDAEAGRRNIRLAVEYADRLGLDFPRKAEAEAIVGTEAS